MKLDQQRMQEQAEFIRKMSDKGCCRIALVSIYNFENTSIRYFIPMLRQAGHQVQVIYFKDYYVNDALQHTSKDEDDFISLIRDFNPHFVALSVGSSTIVEIAQRLTDLIHEKTGTFVLWGGIHAMVAPDESLQFADAVCLGEGELALLEFANAFINNKDITQIQNIWVRKSGKIIKNDVRPLIENIDVLPLPDYSNENKFVVKSGIVPQDPHQFTTWQYLGLSARGCPFSCSFCMNSILKSIFRGRAVRRKTVDSLIHELEYVRQTLPHVGSIGFIDEVFLIDKDWIMEFKDKYREKINMPFLIQNTPGLVEDWHLSELKKAGLFEVGMGIQSGSERIRKKIFHRNTTNEEVKAAAHACHRHGIDLKFDLIFDNPFENESDKKELLDLLLSLPRPFEFCTYSLVWFPKVPITQMGIDKGFITAEDTEDKAHKAFRQWAVSLNYKRSTDEQFWISLSMLTGKPWVPKAFIKWLSKNSTVRKKPQILAPLIKLNSYIYWFYKGVPVLLKGQISLRLIRKRWKYILSALK